MKKSGRFLMTLTVALLALSSCTTIQKGAHGPDYKVLAVSYVDSTGLYWLEKLDEDSRNGCTDNQGTYRSALCSSEISNEFDSEAEAKCRLFGARLPSIEEYARLVKDFQPSATLDRGLSPEIYHQVAMAFKDDMPFAAWTSSVVKGSITQAHYFSWRRGQLQDRVEYRSVELPVRCVRKP